MSDLPGPLRLTSTFPFVGRSSELERLRRLARSGKYVSHYGLAVIQAGLGDIDQAIAELQKGYTEAHLPSAETIRRKMHAAGYSLRKVAKCRPKKSYPRRTPSSAN